MSTTGMPAHDLIVVGAGAMGSATAWQAARRGARVLALDRWTPPHAHGSSHGGSRIIREAYYEHPCYVPLVRRAYDEWAALERASGERLLVRTGGLMIGPEDGVLVSGARRSAREHGLPHEELGAAEVARRFPGLSPAADAVGLLETRAGALFPERCIRAMLDVAAANGAELRAPERVTGWHVSGGVVTVATDRGTHRARRLVLAAGAWLSTLVADLRLPLTVERQVLVWLAPRDHPAWFAPERCPVALWEYAPGRLCYTFPDLGDGVKVGIHHEGEIVDPDAPREAARPEELARARALVERFLPDAAGPLLASTTCLYTDTPDRHFLIDRHPSHPEVLLASACSGHGFKFASAIGAILAELALDGGTDADLEPFSLARLRGSPV